MTRWRFYTESACEPCIIEGVDIFKHEWHPLWGLKADVGNKRYGVVREIQVYAVPGPTGAIFFAAEEMHMSCYNIYIPYVATPVVEPAEDPFTIRAKPDINEALSTMKTHDYDLPECSFDEVRRLWPWPSKKDGPAVPSAIHSEGDEPII